MSGEAPTSDGTTRQTATPKPRGTAKPRAGYQRKTKTEREEYARREAERAKEREAQEAAPVAKPSAGRGRGGARGGRAGAVVNKSERTTSSVVGGVFGAGSGARPERSRAHVDLGVSEALEGGEAINAKQVSASQAGVVHDVVEGSGTGRSGVSGTGRVRASKASHPEDEITRVEDDVEDQPRRDIERIWISSEEDEDVVLKRKGKQRRLSSKTSRPFTGLRPVRAARALPEEQEDTKTNIGVEKDMTDGDQIVDVESDEVQTEDVPETVKRNPPPSPELSKKIPRKTDHKIRETRNLAETVEEKAERLRLQDDMQGLRDAFLHKSDTDDTVDSKEEEAVFGRTDHDRMFLFQLPPLVPQLYDPETRDLQNGNHMDVNPVQVKAEDAGTAQAADAAQKDNEAMKAAPKPPATIYTADSTLEERFPQGLVGTLRIHKSGKVSLDWGGTNMEVRYGTEVDFLQDVVCIEDNAGSNEEDEALIEGRGNAYAMGQINQKMVLVPDWGRLYT